MLHICINSYFKKKLLFHFSVRHFSICIFTHFKKETESSSSGKKKKVKYAHTYCIIRKMKYEMEYKKKKSSEEKKEGRNSFIVQYCSHFNES